ncbi:acyl-CoA dehydrogenase family protein [Aeromicrobium panaciterrae]|uniref:acyl-CoA dehydrogenase family protein n=1 Tax=Aeromicrobium panaciterrae TaxID=363861 RepID=UPI0031D8482C
MASTDTSVRSVSDHRRDLRAWLREHPELPARLEHEPVEIEPALAEEQLLQRELWDAGFGRRGWPVEQGGLGGSAVLRAVTYEELVLAGHRVPQPSYTLETLCPALIRFAPDLASEVLPPALRGDEIWCQGFSEAEAGSDLASLACRATPVGDDWALTGHKLWSSFGHVSQRSAVLARTGEPGHRGISMFLVDLEGASVETPAIRASGGRNEFSEIVFDHHLVAGSRLVGEPGQGWAIAMYLLQWERGMYAWQRQATLRARLAAASERVTGSASSRATNDRVARAWTLLSALRRRSVRTVRLLADGESPGPEVSIDKILLSQSEQAVMDVVRLSHGAAFIDSDDPEDELVRNEWFYSRAASIYGGAVDIQKSIVAEHVLGLPRSR